MSYIENLGVLQEVIFNILYYNLFLWRDRNILYKCNVSHKLFMYVTVSIIKVKKTWALLALWFCSPFLEECVLFRAKEITSIQLFFNDQGLWSLVRVEENFLRNAFLEKFLYRTSVPSLVKTLHKINMNTF